jgi:hypothetical protein
MHPKDTHTFWEVRQRVEAQRLVKPKPVMAKPVRDTVIGREDIINLKIAFGSAKTLDEFLAMV